MAPPLKAAGYGKTSFAGEMWVELMHRPDAFDGRRTSMRLVQAHTAADIRNRSAICHMTIFDNNIVIDGSFPAWQRIVPKYGPEDGRPTVFIQARYVAKVAKFLTDVTGDANTGMAIQTGDGNVSVVRTQAADDRAFVAVMGLRHPDSVRVGLPEWMDTIDVAKNPPAPEIDDRAPEIDDRQGAMRYGHPADETEADNDSYPDLAESADS